LSVENSSVRNFFNEDLLKEIVRAKPDDLAPSLGSVILAIGEGRVKEGETPYYKPSVFFELTYPSDNFLSVLKSVVETLRNKEHRLDILEPRHGLRQDPLADPITTPLRFLQPGT